MNQSLLAEPKAAHKSTSDKYKYPVIFRNRHWQVLTTGAVKGHKIYCHLLEVKNINNEPLSAFRPAQICEYLPLNEVFDSPDLPLIEKLIEFRVASSSPSQIASEICINWLILQNEGYTKQSINQAINAGINLSILCRGFGGSLHIC